MKKGIIILLVLFVIGCGESAKVEKVFNEQRKAACNNDADGFFKHVDMTELADLFFEGKIKIETDEQRKELTKQLKDSMTGYLQNGKDTGYCTRKIIRIEMIDQNTARVFTKSNEISYYETPVLYKKKNDKWLMVKYEDLIGPIVVPAKVFISEFRDNAIVATDKYKDKPIAISGYIMNIDKDETGKVFIAIMPDIFSAIKCYLTTFYSDKVTELKKGQYIELTGMFEKKDTKDMVNLITLKDCTYYQQQ